MNEPTKRTIWNIAFITIGIAIGLVIMPTFYYSADQMIDTCNRYYGTGNWNVSMVKGDWQCTGLSINYYDIDCVKLGVCNASELPDNYTIDLTNRNLTIISKIP